MTATAALSSPAGSRRDPCLIGAKKTLLWYLRHARRARICYQTLEVFQIGTGALIPLAAAVHWPIAVSASLGAAIAVAGGLRSAFRWQGNWVSWSITAAKIQREIALYEAHAAPYGQAGCEQLLASTVANLGLAETVQWASQAEQSEQAQTAQQNGAADRQNGS